MASLETGSNRIVIAGASSLLGAELKTLLEESRFAASEFRLLDEELAAGLLTEAGGEPAVIQPVEEGSFSRARFIFFTGSAEFTDRNLSAARKSGATVVDLSGAALASKDGHTRLCWGPDSADLKAAKSDSTVYVIPSAAGLAVGRLLNALGRAGLYRLAVIFFRPVSEAGRTGIEELESQTTRLLSFQSIGQPVFDAQVAFSLLQEYGPASRENLQTVCARIRREAATFAGRNLVLPSIQVLHAPVFYGYSFSAIAELNSKQSKEALTEICRQAGFALARDPATPLGNLTGAGDPSIHLALPEADPAQPGTWWFWGAADNTRVPAAMAVKLADEMVK